MRSADTSPEAYRFQIEVFRSMSPARRATIAVEMSEEIWDVAADGVRLRHPTYDERMVSWALKRMRLGDDLFRQVWPTAPLVAP